MRPYNPSYENDPTKLFIEGFEGSYGQAVIIGFPFVWNSVQHCVQLMIDEQGLKYREYSNSSWTAWSLKGGV